MDENLKNILNTLGIRDGEYYIDEDGRVMKHGFPSDSFTGIYKDSNGVFKKEGFLSDSNTGLYQNKHGEFKKGGFLFDSDTGIYQDKDGNYVKKGFLYDKETGYIQDKEGNIKKKGFLGNRQRINLNTTSSSSSTGQDGFSFIPYLIFFAILAMGIAILLFIALMIVFVILLLSPIILLIWYLIKKREFKWAAIAGMVISAYLAMDFATNGLICRNILQTADVTSKYISISYAVLFSTTLGFYLDKYVSTKFPFTGTGNFIERKSTSKRRFILAGICLLLLFAFSSYQIIGSSGKTYWEDIKKMVGIEFDYENAIHELVKANNDKNLYQVMNHFSPYIEQFGKTEYPEPSFIENEYNNIWQNTPDLKINIKLIEKISDNIYDLYATYTYIKSSGETDEIPGKTRIVFDEDGKIIRYYEIE